jgi:2,5-dihydroxypyridine 5,6-dioxygenase
VTPSWPLIERFTQQFEACAVREDEVAVVLSETRSRPELVDAARLALASLGAAVAEVVVPTPPQRGPVPIRSTGASQALAGHRAAVVALAAADFVADCTVEGLLHAPELGTILAGGARVLMISDEHPEVFERLAHDPGLRARVERGKERLEAASTLSVTSAAGSDLRVDLAGAVRAGSWGSVDEPGDIAHWPGGLVLCFPAAGTVEGRLVLAPGDVNLTFKSYVRDPVTLAIEADHITDIAGDGVDADLFRSYLGAFGDREAYAVSHLGWGMNPAARWDALALYDKAQVNGTELRAFAGNFLYSTGANEVAGRFTDGHFDLPLRGCTVALDGDPVVVDGVLQGDLAA